MRMAIDVYMTLRDLGICTRSKPEYLRKLPVKLILGIDGLEFVGIDILGPFPKTLNGNPFVLVMKIAIRR